MIVSKAYFLFGNTWNSFVKSYTESLFNFQVKDDTVVHVWLGNAMKHMAKVTKAGLRAILSSCWYLNYVSYGADWSKYYKCEPQNFTGLNIVWKFWACFKCKSWTLMPKYLLTLSWDYYAYVHTVICYWGIKFNIFPRNTSFIKILALRFYKIFLCTTCIVIIFL